MDDRLDPVPQILLECRPFALMLMVGCLERNEAQHHHGDDE